MHTLKDFSRRSWLAVVALVLVLGGVTAHADTFRIDIEKAVAVFGQGQVTIDVYCSNTLDTVGGFEFWFQLDRPDLGEFPLIPDLAALDTVGTLIGSWEYIDDRSLGGVGYDLLATGIADWPPYGDGDLPIAPGDSGVMFRLRLNVPDNPPPPIVEPPHTVQILLNTQFIDNLELLGPQGQSLVVIPDCDTVIDTTFYRCDAWAGDQCLSWSVVSVPPYDSIFVDTVAHPCLDTTAFVVSPGSVRLLMCGDANADDQINVADLTDLIGYLFGGLPPGKEIYPITMDVDASGSFNISDITFYVTYLFAGGPPLSCF